MMNSAENLDVVVIGAGASGLMCAIEAGKRGRRVLVLEHTRKPGNKIRMSGGGRCNFTNYDVSAENYLSHNPHFVKSALSRFSQWDFIGLVGAYQIPYHERDHGQLFCDNSAKDILDMLLQECEKAGASICYKTPIAQVEALPEGGFRIHAEGRLIECASLVVATGGLSIPTMGSTPFGYQLAEQFGIKVWPPTAGLVPFTLQPEDRERFAPLSGIAVDAVVRCGSKQFRENLLFTHRGLSGPAILQISSYWRPGEAISINWLPTADVSAELAEHKQTHPKQQVKNALAALLPQRLISTLLPEDIATRPLNQLSAAQQAEIIRLIHDYSIKPNGTEGYRTAEVTVGGVDCNAISSKTMQAQQVPGLYFIGEVLDVTGWLGGYNFQWAWSSGWCAGQYV